MFIFIIFYYLLYYIRNNIKNIDIYSISCINIVMRQRIKYFFKEHIMTEDNKTRHRKAILSKLPCQYCMNYMERDIRIRSDLNNIKNNSEIIYYLEQIKDPKVSEKIIDLVKSIACS